MDFNFPFPTLRQISLVGLGKCLVHKTGCFAGFPDRPKPYECYDFSLVSSQFDEIVEKIRVPLLKREIVVVVMGMYDQLSDWLRRIEEDGFVIARYGKFEPMFDVNGILDESQTWGRYLERTERNQDISEHYLRDLLRVACQRTLVPHIGTVLRMILILRGEVPTLLGEPHEEFADGKVSLCYWFTETEFDDERPVQEIFRWLGKTMWKNAFFNVMKSGIKTLLNPMQNMDILKKYISDLLLLSATDYVTRSLVSGTLGKWVKNQSTEFLVVYLRHLNQVDQLTVLLGMNGAFCIQEILCCFLRWPFTLFFKPLVALLGRHLVPDAYVTLFSYIVDKIPEKQQFDVFGIGDLLLEFWNIVPSRIKQSLREYEAGNNHFYHFTNNHKDAMRRLHEKNASLYLVISNRV